MNIGNSDFDLTSYKMLVATYNHHNNNNNNNNNNNFKSYKEVWNRNISRGLTWMAEVLTSDFLKMAKASWHSSLVTAVLAVELSGRSTHSITLHHTPSHSITLHPTPSHACGQPWWLSGSAGSAGSWGGTAKMFIKILLIGKLRSKFDNWMIQS